MALTIDAAFGAYWKNLTVKEPKLAQYAKTFQAQLNDASTEGYKVGSTDRGIERDAHLEN